MKKVGICLLLNLGLAILLIFSSGSLFYQTLELKLYDLRMNLRPPPPMDNRILYVEMDEEALNMLGRWPWPRDINAHIVETLKSLGAKQILFDLTFDKPSQFIISKENMKTIIKNIEASEEHATEILKKTVKDYDKIFANSLKNTNVFIGCKFTIIYLPKDIQRDKAYSQLKKEMLAWLKNNPQGRFEDLPPHLRRNPHFHKKEIENIFTRLKIYNLLKNDFQLSITEVAEKLNMELRKIRPHFTDAKKEVIKEIITNLLEKKPEAKLTNDIIWPYQIHNRYLVQLFKEVWEEVKREKEFIRRFGIKIETAQNFLRGIEVSPPILELTKVADGIGFLNGIPDRDGVVRSIPLFIKYKGKLYPNIGIASIIALLKPRKIRFIPNKFLVLANANIDNKTKDIYIPIDNEGRMLINWAGTWQDTFRHISSADIYRLYSLKEKLKFNLSIPEELLSEEDKKNLKYDQIRMEEYGKELKKIVQGAICIIGLTAPGTHDYNPIPYEESYPMVGTHGNVINSILTEKFITKFPKLFNYIALILLALIMGIVLSLLPSITGLFVTIVTVIIIFAISVLLFSRGVWIDLTSPLLLSFFSYLGITSYKFATEEKEKRWIKKAFSRYVSQDVMEEILKAPSKLTLGGERRVLTVLFSDIRGFTSYSEKREPEEVVNILNEYLDAMTKVIFENKGTLDKYVGDEIMAIFGAPHYEEPQKSAKKAVITACRMLERLKELQKKWIKEGKEPLDIGIGINTGEMVVGNMGSTLVMDYTVIGDAVNLGARLESLTRKYNNHIIISEATYNYVKEIAEVKPLEPIKVKGKEIPVMIYEVLGLKPNIHNPL